MINGFSLAGFDLDSDKVQKLGEEKAEGHDVRAGSDLKEFIG